MTIAIETVGTVRCITIDRPAVRNAVDRDTAQRLYDAFVEADADSDVDVAVLTGSDGTFCAGADLGAVARGEGNRVDLADGLDIVGSLGPMGPTRLQLGIPVIAAVEGYAVAGGLELACWCDMRVVASDAKFGVFCRRWGVPLVDGGTVRLPRLIGESRAADMILTGREVDAAEALSFGLANRVTAPGTSLTVAMELAQQLSALPQRCLRSDRSSMYAQHAMSLADALAFEVEAGLATIRSGETREGARRFAAGSGRHGRPEN